MRRLRVSIILFLLAGAGVRGVHAQDAGVRLELAAFRDSLARMSDSAAVARVERGLEGTAEQSADDPVARLRRGLAAVRHGELGNEYRFSRSRREFERASELRPDWPWPLYGKALAHAAEFEDQRADSLEIGKRVGVGHLRDAVAALGAAVALDPEFTPALIELERLAWLLHEPDNWRDALRAFRAAGASRSGDPAVLLALGRLEREVGDPDSAVAALERAGAERAGVNSAGMKRAGVNRAGVNRAGANRAGTERRAGGVARGLVLLEMARTRLQRGLPGGVEPYFAGAAYDDSAVVAGYRADLDMLVADSVLAAFDSARGPERAAVLRRFWDDRARIELRSLEERLREHYRRLQYARRNFALSITRRHQFWTCPYRSGSMEFDDRGIIYIRHGEPTQRIRPYLFTVMPNESWRYDRADGDFVLHFGAGVDIHDYRLVESAIDVLGRCSSSPASSPPPASDVWLSREFLDPMYRKLAAWGGTDAGRRLATEEREIGAASLAVGTTTDSHELRFERPLDVVADVVAVGRRGGRTIAHIVFGVRGGTVPGTQIDGGWRYPVRVRIAAYGDDRRVVGYVDSTTVYRLPVPLDSTRYLFGRAELPLPAGTWNVRTAIDIDATSGAVVPLDSVRVVAADPGGDLRMSDLAVGWRPIALTWRRAADTVYFSPFRSYSADDELELYYELYGLEQGTGYETRLEITPRKRGGLFRRTPPGVRLGFTDVARDGVTAVRRTVGLSDLRPGAYWLDVRVTDARGRTARARTALDVTERR